MAGRFAYLWFNNSRGNIENLAFRSERVCRYALRALGQSSLVQARGYLRRLQRAFPQVQHTTSGLLVLMIANLGLKALEFRLLRS